jgi:hypothetical protein
MGTLLVLRQQVIELVIGRVIGWMMMTVIVWMIFYRHHWWPTS